MPSICEKSAAESSVPERSEGTEVSKMAIREETVFWEFRGFPGAAWFLKPTAEEFW